MPNFSSLRWFSFSLAVSSWWRMLWKKIESNLYLCPQHEMFAKFQLSRSIFIFISCKQLLSAADSWGQMLWKKIVWNFYLCPQDDMCAKFQVSRLIFIFISCQQLLTAEDSCHNFFNGIFIYPLKLIPVPNFSSLG